MPVKHPPAPQCSQQPIQPCSIPTIVRTPNVFDTTRPPEAGFKFGLGLHECLGRAISRVMIPGIVRQCLLVDALGPEDSVDYKYDPVPEAYTLSRRN